MKSVVGPLYKWIKNAFECVSAVRRQIQEVLGAQRNKANSVSDDHGKLLTGLNFLP